MKTEGVGLREMINNGLVAKLKRCGHIMRHVGQVILASTASLKRAVTRGRLGVCAAMGAAHDQEPGACSHENIGTLAESVGVINWMRNLDGDLTLKVGVDKVGSPTLS